jgi:periplasmic protein TonB
MTRDVEKTTPFTKDDKPGARRGKPPEIARRIELAPMFHNFDAAKKRKLPKWAAPLLGAMAIFHVVLFLAMWVKTIWDIEQLERPKNTMDLAIAPPPPPPPPPPKGGVKPKDVTITPKKVRVRDIVQQVKVEKQEAPAPVETGDPMGVEGGVEGGVVGGDLNGVVAAPPPPPPPPPPAPPPNVAPTALDAHRIAGEKNIVPEDVTKTEIQRSGKEKLIGSFKLCITAEGAVSQVNQLKSTGFPQYDNRIVSTIRNEWRYRPFMVNGKATPVCTAVTFIYSQK